MVDRASKQDEARVGKQPVGAGRAAGTDKQELEWQYEAPDGLERVEEWLISRRNGGLEGTVGSKLTIAGGSTKELADIYYDTGDWRLYRASYALRVRREASGKGSEVTVKALTSVGGADGNLWRRREISESIGGEKGGVHGEATGPVGEFLKALVGNQELRPIFEVRTRRRIFNLLLDKQTGDGGVVQDASGDIRLEKSVFRVGKVALDASEIPLGVGAEPARLARVEVEVDASATDDDISLLEEFVRTMGEVLELRPAKFSKYEAGLFATGQSPEVSLDLGPSAINGSLSVGEVAFAVLRRQFAAIKAHEAGTRLGEDSEELHDMRVATRRMRAAIKLFQDALPERTRWFEDELRFFAGVLGDVRDLDVQLEQLEEEAARIDDEESLEAISRVVAALDERRSGARESLLEALDSVRYERFGSSFADMLRRGPAGKAVSGRDPAAADAPILTVAPDILSRSYRRWRKAAKRINDSSSPEEYHDLRKEGKRLRYALEFLSDLYSKKTTNGIIKPLKKIQDGLGEHQDLIVASDLLEELARGGNLLPRTVFEMGILAGRYRQEAADLRASVPASKAYSVLTKGKAWKDFEKAMEKQRSSAKADGKKKK